MARKIAFAVLLLTLTITACQPTQDSAEPSQATSTEADEPAASPLEGAWRLVARHVIAADGTTTDDTPQENLFLFTENHYSIAYASGDERFPLFSERWNPTETEKADRFSSMVVNTGTYELTGSKLVTRPLFALVPGYINGEAEIDYELSGDTLTLTYVNIVSSEGVQISYFAEGNKSLLRLIRLN